MCVAILSPCVYVCACVCVYVAVYSHITSSLATSCGVAAGTRAKNRSDRSFHLIRQCVAQYVCVVCVCRVSSAPCARYVCVCCVECVVRSVCRLSVQYVVRLSSVRYACLNRLLSLAT